MREQATIRSSRFHSSGFRYQGTSALNVCPEAGAQQMYTYVQAGMLPCCRLVLALTVYSTSPYLAVPALPSLPPSLPPSSKPSGARVAVPHRPLSHAPQFPNPSLQFTTCPAAANSQCACVLLIIAASAAVICDLPLAASICPAAVQCSLPLAASDAVTCDLPLAAPTSSADILAVTYDL